MNSLLFFISPPPSFTSTTESPTHLHHNNKKSAMVKSKKSQPLSRPSPFLVITLPCSCTLKLKKKKKKRDWKLYPHAPSSSPSTKKTKLTFSSSVTISQESKIWEPRKQLCVAVDQENEINDLTLTEKSRSTTSPSPST